MRLTELLGKRNDCKDTLDKNVEWWTLKNLEKLKESGGDYAMLVEELSLRRRLAPIIQKGSNYVKSIEKVVKTLKKKDLELLRKKNKDLERATTFLQTGKDKLDKKKAAKVALAEANERKQKKVKLNGENGSQSGSKDSQFMEVS